MEDRFSGGVGDIEEACLRENYCGITYAELEKLGATYQFILEAYKDSLSSGGDYDSILSFRPSSARRSERLIPEDYLHSPFGGARNTGQEPEFAIPVIAKRDFIEERVNIINLEDSLYPRKLARDLENSRLPFDELSHRSYHEHSTILNQSNPKVHETVGETASTEVASSNGKNSKRQSDKESLSAVPEMLTKPQTGSIKVVSPQVDHSKPEIQILKTHKPCMACPTLIKQVDSVYVLLQKVKAPVAVEPKKSPAKSTKTVTSQSQAVGTSTPELKVSQTSQPVVVLPLHTPRKVDPIIFSNKLEKTSVYAIRKTVHPEICHRTMWLEHFVWSPAKVTDEETSTVTARNYPAKDTPGTVQTVSKPKNVVVLGSKPVSGATHQIRSRPLLSSSKRLPNETPSRSSSNGPIQREDNRSDHTRSDVGGFGLKDVLKTESKLPDEIPLKEESIKINSDLSEKNSISRISRHSYLKDGKEDENGVKSKEGEFNLALLTQNESVIERKSNHDSSLLKKSTDDDSRAKILTPMLESPGSKSGSLTSQIVPEVSLKPMLSYPDEKDLLKAQEKSRNIRDAMKVNLVSSNKHTKPIAPLGRTSMPEIPQFARHLKLEGSSQPVHEQFMEHMSTPAGFLANSRGKPDRMKIVENKDDSDNLSQKTKLFRIKETQNQSSMLPNGITNKKAPGPLNSFAVNAAFAPLSPDLFMYQTYDQAPVGQNAYRHQRRDSGSGLSETSDKTKKAVKTTGRSNPVPEVSEKNQALNQEMKKIESLILQYTEASKWSPDRERLRMLLSENLKQKSTVFSAYSIDFVDFLTKHGQFTFAPKGSAIFNEGDTCSQMGIVIYGVVQHKCKSGLATLTHGGFICEEAMLRPEPVLMQATVVVSKSCLLWLPGNSLQELRDFCERGKRKNEYVLFVAQLKKQLGMKS